MVNWNESSRELFPDFPEPLNYRRLLWWAIKSPVFRIWFWIAPIVICGQIEATSGSHPPSRSVAIVMVASVLGLLVSGLRLMNRITLNWDRMEEAIEAPPCDITDNDFESREPYRPRFATVEQADEWALQQRRNLAMQQMPWCTYCGGEHYLDECADYNGDE